MPSARKKLRRPIVTTGRSRRSARPAALAWLLRPRVLLGVFVLLVAIVGASELVGLLTRPDLRAGSVELRDAGPLRREAPPSSYQVVYRVESRAGGEEVVGTDVLSVRRPFVSRLESRSGPPPGKGVQSVQVSAFGKLGQRGRSAEGTILVTVPGIALADLRSDAILQEAVDRRILQRRERRRVHGRDCQVYRSGGPINAGELVPVGRGDDEHSDFCIDATGLIVEDVWFLRGKVLRRRAAVKVNVGAELPDQLFVMPEGREISAQDGSAGLRRLQPSSRPPGETFWELASPPEGFTHYGRFAVAEPQLSAAPEAPAGRRVGSVMDVYVRGSDVLLIDRGGTIDQSKVFEPHRFGEPVDLGAIGKGELIIRLGVSQVRVARSGGNFVRVAGTLTPADLIAFAQRLREEPGGQLVCVNEAGQPEPCSTPAPATETP